MSGRVGLVDFEAGRVNNSDMLELAACFKILPVLTSTRVLVKLLIKVLGTSTQVVNYSLAAALLAPCCIHHVNQGELSQCFKHDDSTIKIVLLLLLLLLL